MTARAVAALSGCAYPILPGAQGFDIKGGTVSVTVPEDTLQADKPSVPSGAWEEITVTDGFGYTITISARPERIVSLAPANTEILFAVGAGDRVVAVTEYCTFPEEAATLPVIGGYSTINIERIVAANPDLIFAYHGNGEENINYLKHLGYNVITLNADSIAGTLHDIRLVGEAVGCTETAEKLVSDMEVRLSAVSEKLAGVPESEKPTMVHSMWTDPLWVSGNHTFQNEMIQYAGGINAVVTTEGWGIVTLEKFLLIDPDIIFVDTGMGMGEGAQDVLKNYFLTEPRLSTLTAVQNGHVYAVNADIIDRGGPRLVEGVEAIASIAHPEIFGEYEPDRSTVSSPAPVLGIIAGLAAVYLWKRKE
ncbi:ABC transporter substrate-binding protein [Methanocorpusculaceae archaeon]|nr:ABC transporter substrate-binding protein [Methanocorpusculaceae archaeon]